MTTETPKRRHWLRSIMALVIVWPLAGALLALMLWPSTPVTPRGWVLLFVFGPAVWAILEWGGGRLFSREMGERISPASFSWARILFALLVFLVLLIPVAWWVLASPRSAP